MHGWQNKGGRGGVVLGGGSLATSLVGAGGLLVTGNVSEVDDSRMNGVIVKAMAGFCNVVNALHVALPGVDVIPASLLITTTKNAALARAELSSSRWKNCFRIPEKVWSLTAAAVGTAYRQRLAAAPVTVTLFDGPSWANDCVDAAIISLLGPLPLVPAPLGTPSSTSTGRCDVM